MKKTTIILGAGVNKEIDLEIDIGSELLKNISNRVTDRTSDTPNFSKALERHFKHLNESVRSNFLFFLDKYIDSSENPSIDGFMNEVETYPEFATKKKHFLEIGLLMVIGHVTGWEGKKTLQFLSSAAAHKTWLGVLGRYIKSLLRKKSIDEELNIITFNYDRILERYLLDSIGSETAFAFPTRQFMDKHIHHVYGRIGRLEGLAEAFQREDTIEFGIDDNSNFKHLAKFKNNIKFIRNSIDTEKIKDLVKGANKLIVLGYGLDPINNRRIGLLDWNEKDYDQNLKFNIYPGASTTNDFSARRRFEERIRAIRIDADIQYRSCKEFMNYALSAQLVRSKADMESYQQQRKTY